MESDGNQNNADLGNGARKAVEAVRTPYFLPDFALRDLFLPSAALLGSLFASHHTVDERSPVMACVWTIRDFVRNNHPCGPYSANTFGRMSYL